MMIKPDIQHMGKIIEAYIDGFFIRIAFRPVRITLM
jgi:hypothetical protein